MNETGMDEILGRMNGWNRIGLLWGGARGWSLLHGVNQMFSRLLSQDLF